MRTTTKNTQARKSSGECGTNKQISVPNARKSTTTRNENKSDSDAYGPNKKLANSAKSSKRERCNETKTVLITEPITANRRDIKKPRKATSLNASSQRPITVTGEIFTWNQVGIICGIDAVKYSVSNSEVEKSTFVASNQYAYYMACNSWMLLLQDLSGDPLPEVARCILSEGLAPMIALANTLSNSLIEGQVLPSSPFGYFIQSVTQRCNENDVLKTLLQGLRYLKRFSPANTNSLISDELIAFQRRNTAMKMFDEVSIPMYHILGLRAVLNDTFRGWDRKYKRIEKQFDWFSSLPSNATADTGNTFTSKWKSVIDRIPFASQLCPPAGVPVNSQCDRAFAQRICKVSAIPKSYKARRIIASEECYRQTRMSICQDTLTDCLNNTRGRYAPGGRVLIHDQSRNRQLAREGSITDYYATLDCSAASDTVSWWLVREVFPHKLFKEMNSLRSTHYELKEPRTKNTLTKVLYMFSSMGSRVTFPVETILFWGIACYACEIAAHLLGDKFDASEVSVYGDDTIVPSKYAEVVIHYLKVFGFTPNVEKSFFGNEGFRESCGIECYRGFDVSSKYFPRSTVSDDAQGAIRLVSLQHRVYQHRLCSNFLCSVLSTRFGIQYTLPNSLSTSLWSEYPIINYRDIPRKLYSTKAGYEYAKCHSDMSDYQLETHVSTKYKTDTNPVTVELAEQLAYLAFLKFGPKYANALDERHGISEKPMQHAAYATTSTTTLSNF